MDPVTIAMLIFPTHGAPWSRRNVPIIQVNASRTLSISQVTTDRESRFKDQVQPEVRVESE